MIFRDGRRLVLRRVKIYERNTHIPIIPIPTIHQNNGFGDMNLWIVVNKQWPTRLFSGTTSAPFFKYEL